MDCVSRNISDFLYYKKIVDGKDYATIVFDKDRNVKISIEKKCNIIHVEQSDDNPSFYTSVKEFWANGAIRLIGKQIGDIKTGVWKYYNNKGYKTKEIDEDKKFGKMQPYDILILMQCEGLINLTTGEGRFNPDGYATFSLSFFQPQRNHPILEFRKISMWQIVREATVFNKYVRIIYIINGETGAIISKKEINMNEKNKCLEFV